VCADGGVVEGVVQAVSEARGAKGRAGGSKREKAGPMRACNEEKNVRFSSQRRLMKRC